LFIPVPNNEIPKSKHKEVGGKVIDELKEFMASGLPCAEHIVPEGRSVQKEYNVFQVAIRRHNYPVKIVTRRKERMFFVMKEE